MKCCSVSSTPKAASSHYFKLKEGQFRLDIKKFFTMRVVKYLHRLPRGGGSIETFKARLDRALRNLA